MDVRCCSVCGTRIPKGRIAALPDATTCVRCSRVEPITEDTLGVVDLADDADLLRSMQSTTSADRSRK